MKFDSADNILDFAVAREQEASDFYSELAGNMENEHIKKIFAGFAAEEQAHKAKLLAVKDGRQMVLSDKSVQNLKIADYLADIEMKPDLSTQEALVVAMKAELAAFKLYSDLADATDDAGLRSLFLGLAQEEARHKLRFEIEYDEGILTEN